VLDNQMARLQVGNNVPYLSQSSQSTVTSTAAIINSVNYQETGVILQVVPRVNSGGLVTLDISQEVSDVAQTMTSNIDSPTFSERKVRSHVVIQDGQTVGLAGLIRDNVSRSNGGIPYLKDIPVLGSLFGTQANTRDRTELLILITPHVLQDQRDARSLTQDMREKLLNAGLVPQDLQALPLSGSSNPNAALRQR
jgi:general secretion pathway protein D